MKNYEPVMSFDEHVAEIYDEVAVHAGTDSGGPAVGDVPATVAFLEELAHGGPALELAIGTGRIALPLRSAESTSTASTSPRRWSPSCGRSRVVTGCR